MSTQFSTQSINIQLNRYLSEFSTFGIGGPIQYLMEVHTPEEAKLAFFWADQRQLSVLVVGKGSNCLFPDAPYRGLVILNRIDFFKINDLQVDVGAGFSFSLLGHQTAKSGLSGLEFASGIPATVGGAIFMNAGANGRETCESLVSARYLFRNGEIKEFLKNELQFGYRFSSFQMMNGCILSAKFQLQKESSSRSRQLEIIQRRIKTQPLKEKSIGCVFRNPPQYSAGELIDRCGLKGMRIGGAKISEMHANFIINDQNATAKDVLELIQEIQTVVLEKTGVHLHPELRIISGV